MIFRNYLELVIVSLCIRCKALTNLTQFTNGSECIKKFKYVALSRATKKENINII